MHQMDKAGQLLPQCGGQERTATQMSPLGRDRAAQGPQITPSESHWASQKKAEAPVASSSVPVIEASTPQGATSDVPAPMETGGAGDGQSWAEQTEVEDDFKRHRPAEHPRLYQGGGKTDQHFPSCSRMRREDAPPPRSSTGMQDSSHWPITMWPPWE